jgi:hypothetical protein
LHSSGARAVFIPSTSLEILVSHRAFWLAEAKDVWFGSGLQDPTGASGSYLGQNLETRLRWKPCQYAMVEVGYAHFFKGSYLDRVPGSPRTPDSDYFYAEIDIRARWFAR